MSKKYTTSDIAAALAVSDRTARRKLTEHVTILNGRYELSEAIFKYIVGLEDTTADTVAAAADMTRNAADISVDYEVIEQTFTVGEYKKLERILIEHPILQKELEYHKESVRKHQKQMEVINDTLNKMATAAQSRNIIDAAEKGILPKGFKNE